MNGPPTMATPAIATQTTQSGMPGKAITTTSATETRSQAIITSRRGHRSASPANRAEPRNDGV